MPWCKSFATGSWCCCTWSKILFFWKKVKSYLNLPLFQVYGEDAVRVTPPNSTVNLTVSGDEVEGPNGECPPVSLFLSSEMCKTKSWTLSPPKFSFSVLGLKMWQKLDLCIWSNQKLNNSDPKVLWTQIFSAPKYFLGWKCDQS